MSRGVTEIDQTLPSPKRAPARHRTRLWYEILNSIMAEERIGISAKITRVQNHVGLPSDRFRIHLQEMEQRGLIQRVHSLNSTEEGRSFVLEYEKLLRALTRLRIEQ